MPEGPKRPGLPAPDPNWELELHGPGAGARKAGPESKDELLAHALLRAEPDPIDLGDDFGELDLERSTLPPPEAMNLHVARMMAQAELIERLDDGDGDRPTPLFDDERLPGRKAGGGRAPEPPRKEPPRKEPPRKEPPRKEPRRGGAVVRFDADRKDTPLVEIDPTSLSPRKAPVTRGGGAGAAAASKWSAPEPVKRATPEPVKRATPAKVAEAATRAVPGLARKAAAVMAAAAERKETPEPLSLSRVPLDRGLADLSDLPAVFSLDGLDEPASEAAISPALAAPPVSEPAISPPFGSIDVEELAASLEASRGAPPETLSAIQSRFAAGDFGRALVLAESALDAHPGDAAVARYAEDCREMLYQRYLERLGAGDHIPRLAMNRAALTGLTLDHRAGFLLSCVDGGSTLEEIIDVSAMPRLEAVRLLYELVQEGVIEMASPR